jgi:hypothetical protein
MDGDQPGDPLRGRARGAELQERWEWGPKRFPSHRAVSFVIFTTAYAPGAFFYATMDICPLVRQSLR